MVCGMPRGDLEIGEAVLIEKGSARCKRSAEFVACSTQLSGKRVLTHFDLVETHTHGFASIPKCLSKGFNPDSIESELCRSMIGNMDQRPQGVCAPNVCAANVIRASSIYLAVCTRSCVGQFGNGLMQGQLSSWNPQCEFGSGNDREVKLFALTFSLAGSRQPNGPNQRGDGADGANPFRAFSLQWKSDHSVQRCAESKQGKNRQKNCRDEPINLIFHISSCKCCAEDSTTL